MFFHTLQMFRKKSLRKLAVFRVVLQNKGKNGALLGEKAGKRGYSGNTTTLSWRRPWRQNGAISWENDALEGRNKGRRTEKMGRDGRKQEPLTAGKLFSPYYIYIAQERRKWPLWAKAPPPALLGKAKNPSPILRDGLGMGSGRKATREQANFSYKPDNRTTALE